MAVGYALNCLATLYDTDKGSVALIGEDVAASPVIPPFANAQGPIAGIAPGHSAFHAAAADQRSGRTITG